MPALKTNGQFSNGESEMKTYDFTLVLSEPVELDEVLADRLFEAGCDDGTPGSCGTVVSIDFSREAADLETAIRSAIANAASAGCVVAQVKIDAAAVAV
jgi:hypothetical protein